MKSKVEKSMSTNVLRIIVGYTPPPMAGLVIHSKEKMIHLFKFDIT